MTTLDSSGPSKDYRLMAVVVLEGHGKPGQLCKEYRQALERMLWNEFGELAQLTILKLTDEEGDEVVITDSDVNEDIP